jgi:putative transposase
MITLLLHLLRLLPFLVGGPRQLALENLALRQQLAVYKRTAPRPRLRTTDRLLWVGLARVWTGWRHALVIVSPDTVLRWQRRRFREYWTQLSGRSTGGRPPVNAEITALVRKMTAANPLGGAPRIHGELLKLGIDIAERTVSRLMPKRRPQPSQPWRTFLANHVRDLVSIDFFTVPTARLRVLFVLIVLAHHRRRVIHLNVTEHPTAAWTAQQIVDAFPDDSAPSYLLRDRDTVYGDAFRQRVKGMGIKEVLTAPHSPWQNPFAQRLIGSIRRECLNHVLVLSERHLHRILTRYFAYYHQARTHLSLDKDTPPSGPSSFPRRARSYNFPKSAACIIATSAKPRSPASPGLCTVNTRITETRVTGPSAACPSRSSIENPWDRESPGTAQGRRTADADPTSLSQPALTLLVRVLDPHGESDEVLARDRCRARKKRPREGTQPHRPRATFTRQPALPGIPGALSAVAVVPWAALKKSMEQSKCHEEARLPCARLGPP